MIKKKNNLIKIDLTPQPLILPTLGEINLELWQCIAEFIDNSVDGFLMAKNNGYSIAKPTISISLPKNQSDPNAFISVIDNGPGMNQNEIVNVARAGYSSRSSGNNEYLGLWGMGLNIASARLGKKMEIMSLTSNGVSSLVVIDLEEMVNNNSFSAHTRELTKQEKLIFSKNGGTLIKISKLKPEIVEFLLCKKNRDSVSSMIGRVYSTMLVSSDPISLCIKINKNLVPGHRHSYWQKSDAPKGKTVYAEIVSDKNKSNIRGWIGLQRYGHNTNFGIDFVRNGRKIEIGNKDVFDWDNDGILEKEYPIDDPRGRGRIIGEIHLDHCSVPFAKDRFHRIDPVWNDMLNIVRNGKDFPLRKNIAKRVKGASNSSPLGKIYEGFRRMSPFKTTDDGGWLKLLSFPPDSATLKKEQNTVIPPSGWYSLLEQDVTTHIRHYLRNKEQRDKSNKNTKSKDNNNSYGKKHFPALYNNDFVEKDPYIRGIIEDIGAMSAEKSPIACCICLRALVEVTLKTKITEMVDDMNLVESLTLRGEPKKQYYVGLGVLLSNIKGHYAKNKNIFGISSLDSVTKAFAKNSSGFTNFLNSITHGNIISGSTHADDFAKQCAMVVVKLLTYK